MPSGSPACRRNPHCTGKTESMKGPVSSLKVLDFSTLLPGPFASLLLADLGAEVLRIESPTRMDLVRVLPPQVDGVSASHAYLNRNKRSLALDLKKPEALEVVCRLVAEYDIVLEQFQDLPVVLFTARYNKVLNQQVLTPVTVTRSIAKATGKWVYDKELAGYQMQSQFHTLTLNRRQGHFDLVIHSMRLRHFYEEGRAQADGRDPAPPSRPFRFGPARVAPNGVIRGN